MSYKNYDWGWDPTHLEPGMREYLENDPSVKNRVLPIVKTDRTQYATKSQMAGFKRMLKGRNNADLKRGQEEAK